MAVLASFPLVALLLAACATPEARQAAPALACADLAGSVVRPQQIGLPTGGATVLSAEAIRDESDARRLSDYCRVTASIRALESDTPEIRFQLNLPLQWNGKAVQMGGSAYNGAVVTGTGPIPFASLTAPLSQGYATYGSDSGHAGAGDDARFALNDAALANFGHAHIKKAHDAALALIRLHYGRAPRRSYFAGASTGGREAMTAAQRWPQDYDGVLAIAPAINFVGVRLHGIRVGQAAYVEGGFIPREKQALIRARALASCDADDGIADGIIGDVRACRAKAPEIFAALRCPGGRDGAASACLSDAQLRVVRALADDLLLRYPLAAGVDRHPGYNILQGADFSGSLGLGTSPRLTQPPNVFSNGYLFAQGDAFFRHFVARDPARSSLAFDPREGGGFRQRLRGLSNEVGAANPDLSRFRERGGKLLLMHGLADEVISPNATIAYYEGQVLRWGREEANAFIRLLTVPGFGHGGGAFVPAWEALDALDTWVERGSLPATMTGVDLNAATRGRARPLCPYPQWPRYQGGDAAAAGSFRCVG
ncbi:feruloyl esterase [Noviherbaspirillum humi]|uniref:Feruloyl esterase n=1 Tax=Noviherbaspirillum humi TaxID=1688639 RepID=A0A239DM35_9BURK|nr:tannase/feruloyl esterase family alpha/beta hydrolase [Noviherbaspirillum humi]SNS33477.1 feruloyl esterase [Noviherbaspirillum humi]